MSSEVETALVSRSGKDIPFIDETPPMERPENLEFRAGGILGKCGLKIKHALWIRKLAAEFFGLMFFAFIGGQSLRTGHLLSIAAAHGLTIALLIIGCGHISGGHLNPAVTLGILINQKISILGALGYWLAQFLGSILGGFFIWATLRSKEYLPINGGALYVDLSENGISMEGQAFLMEVIISSLLVYTVLLAAVDRSDNHIAALGIGFCVFVGVLAGGTASGGSMNPARSFGPLVAYSGGYNGFKGDMDTIPACAEDTKCLHHNTIWRYYWIHLIGPLTGGLLAGAVYRIFYQNRKYQ